MTCQNINIKEEIERLQTELNALKAEYEKRSEKWEPKEGIFHVSVVGAVKHALTLDDRRKFGIERETHKHAESLRDLIHRVAIIDAYVKEYAPDWEADWDDPTQPKCSILFDHSNQEWRYASRTMHQYVDPVMPPEIVKQLCADLNCGRVAFYVTF